MKHIVTVIIFIAIVTVALVTTLDNINLLPPQASAEGIPIDWLFGLHLKIIAFLFALIMVFVVYSVVVFRRKPDETGDGDYFHGNSTLEIVWTIVPLIIVLYFGYLGTVTLADITAPVEGEMVVEVTGSQWSWRFDYPEAGITSTELYLPVGHTVLFKMTSLDVIHSFWVPEFRVKQDTVPGMIKELRITPIKTGTFKVRCAELCGLDHAYMLANVNVLSEEDYNDWFNGQQEQLVAAQGASPAVRGEELSKVQGCKACHSVDGSAGVGPTWQGIYGSERALEDGSTVTVDDEYLHNAIVNPGDQVVKGFTNVMPPTFGDNLTDEEINDLIEYIKTLE